MKLGNHLKVEAINFSATLKRKGLKFSKTWMLSKLWHLLAGMLDRIQSKTWLNGPSMMVNMAAISNGCQPSITSLRNLRKRILVKKKDMWLTNVALIWSSKKWPMSCRQLAKDIVNQLRWTAWLDLEVYFWITESLKLTSGTTWCQSLPSTMQQVSHSCSMVMS